MLDQRHSTVLVYHDVSVKRDDVKLLTGPYWLNDQIIAFYFQYMEFHMFRSHSKKFLFVPPPITQLIKIGTEDASTFLDPLQATRKNVIFFAVNDNQQNNEGGTHWSLLVFSRIDEAFFSFDSLNNYNSRATSQLVDILRKSLHCQWAEFVRVQSLQQNNGHDCGIYVLANVEMICHYFLRHGVVRHVPVLTHEAAKRKRSDILTVIRELAGNHGDAGSSYLS